VIEGSVTGRQNASEESTDADDEEVVL